MTCLPPDFALVSYLVAWERLARYPLAASYPEPLTVGALLALGTAAEQAAFLDLPLHYPPLRGAESLRATIAATGYETCGPDDVLVFSGADEAVYAVFQALLEPGDHAIVVTPCYQSLEVLPAARAEVSALPLDPERGWSLDPEHLRALIRPNTRMLVINQPHNPTGTLLSAEVFEAIIAICRQHGLWIFSDEVYRLTEYDASRRLPAMADVYERGISLNVTSKAYGLPGLRVGWIACHDRALIDRAVRLKQYLTVCGGLTGEFLTEIALRASDVILGQVRVRATANRALLGDFLSALPDRFDWTPPDAGVLAFPRYKGAEGVEVYAARLVEATGVLIVPSTVYRSPLTPVPADRLRIGFGAAHAAEAITAWAAWERGQ